MDPVTAFLIGILMMLANGGVLGLMHRDLPVEMRPAAFSWRVATLLFAMACVLFVIQRALPAGFVLPLANGLTMLGFTGYFRALCQFYGRPDKLWILIPAAIGTAGVGWFAAVQPSIVARIVIVSVTWTVLALSSTAVLLSPRPPDRARSRLVLAAIFGMVAIFVLLRLAYYLATGLQPGATVLDATNWMNVVTPMIVSAVPVIGTTAFLLLCSERIRTNAEKLAASKALFLANMSHELRTPLNAILGFTQILSRGEGLTEQQRSNLATVNRSGEHLLMLINRILDMAKLEEGKVELRPAPFDLGRMLDEVQEMFVLAAQGKGLELVVELESDLPRAFVGDELRLRQVLINLLNNAVKFTDHGRIGVSVKPVAQLDEGNWRLRFQVQDTGIGIRQEELDDLFQVFTQGEAGRQARSGTGLGLALSRRFVELMDGTMAVSSAPGQGSLFWFEVVLPATNSGIPTQLGLQIQTLSLAGDGRRPRLLVVDDHRENRELLCQMLTDWGFEVSSAGNGEQAVSEWIRFAPDLTWMDLRMPVMNGVEACQAIQRAAHAGGWGSPKVVAVTASTLDLPEHVLSEQGFVAMVGKPFRECEIRWLLQAHLGVRFVGSEAARSVGGTPEDESATLAAGLAALDRVHLQKLASAVMRADFDDAATAIADIESGSPGLGGRLRRLLDAYRFDRLQVVVERSGAARPSQMDGTS